MAVPTIDFSNLSTAPAELEDALSNVGFLQLVNVGIDEAVLRNALQQSQQFFSRSADEKAGYRYRNAAENFGYQGLQEENLDPTAPADIKETFTMRNILQQSFADERWPGAEFKQAMLALYKNALAAAYAVQRVIALQLGVNEDFFTRKHRGENISLRLLHYPPVPPGGVSDKQLGAGAHTDYGFLTLLFQDDVGGLQVLDKQQQWQNATPMAQAVLVNCGDLLERWTNGRFQSTLHRVQPVSGVRSRYSIAFFVDPDDDTWVEPLPSCVSEQNPPLFEGTTAGEHILAKLNHSHIARFEQ
ncbi:isopenicillin N synthase family dioxygenase [Halioxenophilus aromaticivorans]|uniref:2-oxoglutarate and iron-dependent oxygenase domain-containing protein n=1 Tax=Halioxenophilus aromaticivorans TaxID=1306992 RepID=A0AAV3U8X4_9ALTE